jgi:hypothetical protein
MEIEQNFLSPAPIIQESFVDSSAQPSSFDNQDPSLKPATSGQILQAEASVLEKKKVKKSTVRVAPANNIGLMLSYAQTNGYINAKFLRCKALHDFLFVKLWDKTSFKNNGTSHHTY